MCRGTKFYFPSVDSLFFLAVNLNHRALSGLNCNYACFSTFQVRGKRL